MRDHSIDFLRFISAAFVVLLHSTAIYMYEKFNTNSFLYINILNGLTRWTVPIFVMISGAFMLKKNIPISDLFKKYIFHIFSLLFLWNIIYYFIKFGLNMPIRLGQIIYPNWYHLCFLYMLLSIYILIPILKVLANSKQLIYLLVLWGIFDITTNTIQYWHPSDTIKNFYFIRSIDYIGYFILGYYLYTQHTLNKIWGKIILWLGFLGICISIILTAWYTRKENNLNLAFYDNLTIFVLLPSIAIFMMAKNLKVNTRFIKTVTVLSQYSLGIYLIHPLILRYLPKDMFINNVLNVITLWIITLLISIFVTNIITRIPLLKYLVK